MGRVINVKGGSRDKQKAGALSKNGKIIIGIIIILLILAAAIGGYMYWKKYKATKAIVETVVDSSVEAAVQVGGKLLKNLFR